MWNVLWIAVFSCFAALAAVGAATVNLSGQRDPGDLYLVLGPHPDKSDAFDVVLRDVGPRNASLSRLIWAMPASHQVLVEHGAWIIPASQLAALCGFAPSQRKGV